MKALPLPLGLALLTLAACSKGGKAVPVSSDLAALGILNAMEVEPTLVSSGQPSKAQFMQLKDAGFETVICLRPSDEPGTGWEEALAQELGLELVRIPVKGNDALDATNAQALDDAMAAAGGARTLVWCASGNRVGGLLALRALHVQGLTPEEALAYGLRGGLTRSEDAVRVKLGLPHAD